MKETEVNVFKNGITIYFEQSLKKTPIIETPFIKKKALILDYTALIGLSGIRKGSMFVTVSKGLIVHITKETLKTDELSDELLVEMLCELTNNLAGFVQKIDESISISIPNFIKNPDDIDFNIKTEAYVIPFNLESNAGAVIVGLD